MHSAPFITSSPSTDYGDIMSDEDTITKAAQCITKGDFMSAMSIFEDHVKSNPDRPIRI